MCCLFDYFCNHVSYLPSDAGTAGASAAGAGNLRREEKALRNKCS